MAHKEIKVSEYYSKLIANLPTRPNASPGDFSGGGLSAIQLKQAFDAVPIFIIDRLNGLIQYINEISDEGLSAYILEAIKSNIADSVDTGISLNIQTLSDLFDAIKSGDLSKVLTVESRGESLDAVVTSLFSGITETIDKEIEAAKASGKFDLVSVTHEWYGSVLALTSASGTTYTDLRGPQGPQGEGFKISRTYSSIAAMQNGFSSDDVPENGFVIINTGFVNDEDNAKLFIKGKTQYNYLTDLSGAQGIKGEKGDPGKGIVSIALVKEAGRQKQYKVTYTEGQPYFFIVTDGADGVSATHSWDGTTLTVTSASGTSSRDLRGERGEKGDPGERGEGFRIQETYKSVSDMEAASLTDGVPVGGFVLISTDDVEDPNNAKLYVKASTGAYQFLTDLSGAQGIQGVGIDRIVKLDGDPPEDQYRIIFTNDKYFDYSIKHGESIRVSETTESTESGGKNVVKFSDEKTITIRNGRDGRDGIDGDSLTITKIEQSDEAGGVSTITFSDAGKTLKIKNGYNGEDGSSVGIDIITTSDEDGGINSVTFTDGKTLEIRNGSKGSSVEVDSINETAESGGENIVVLKDKNGNHELHVRNGKDGASITIDNTSSDENGTTVHFSDNNSVFIQRGKEGKQGPSGPQGPQGEGFKISRTFVSLDDMFSSYGPDDEVPDYGFVLIQSPRGAEDPDNAKLYVKNPELGYVYLTDLSGAQGIKGDTGNGIKRIYETGDDGGGTHYLYVEYTNGGGAEFELFDGPQGPQGSPGKDGKDGTSVTVQSVDYDDDGAVVTFSDNTQLSVSNGKDGGQGPRGERGEDGTSVKISEIHEYDDRVDVFFDDDKGSLISIKHGKAGSPGKDGTSVSVSSVTTSTEDGGKNVVTFTDRSTLEIRNGSKGSPGKDGNPGKDGSSVVVYEVEQNSESGGYNTVVFQDKNGNHELQVRNGKDGGQGPKGNDGEDGTSVSVDETIDDGSGVSVWFTDGKNFYIKHGRDGKDGEKGDTGPQGPGKFNVELGTTTFADIVEAYQENKVVEIDYGGIIMPLVMVSVEDKICLFLVSEPGAAIGVMIDAYGNTEEVNIPYVMAEDLLSHAANEGDAKHLTEDQLGIVASLPKIVQNDVDKWDSAYDAVGDKLDKSARGAANGVASLDSSGKVPSSQLPSYLPLSGGTLNTNAKIKLSTYGTRFLTLSGNSIDADMSNETGGWAGNFASVKAPGGTTTTMLGWYGGASGLTHIFMGGSYSDPAMKMTPAGQFTFKNAPKVGLKEIATTDQIPTATSELTADRLVGDAGGEIEFDEYGEGYSLIDIKANDVRANGKEIATEEYVDQKVAGIVDSSPEALNTLNELAAALGDDPNFATTVANDIGKKVDKTTTVNGHALSGNVTVSKSDVGLGNVANERQYSANNPPPYPVTSVAGRTGAVTLKYSDLSGVPVSVVEEGGNDVAVIGAPYAKLSNGNFLVTEDGVKDEVESVAALKSEGIFYIEGTGSTVGEWLGTSTRFTEPYDGLAIRYKIPVAGSTTTTLNINNKGEVTVYRFNDTKLTTHFEAGMIVNLIYHADYQGEGTPRWMCSDYDSNTNTYLRVYRRTNTTSNQTTYGKDFPLLVSNSEASKIGTAGSNNTYTAVYGVMWDDTSKVPTLNPVTGELKAVKFTGTFNGNATSATSATKATQDASGNVITSTYAKKTELPSTTQMDNWDSAYSDASAALTKANAALPKAGGTMTSTAAIKWPTKNSLNPFIGYCTASSDGTFLIGSLEGTKWDTGLAIGGSSKNLLWKGKQVAVKTDIPSVYNGTLTIKRNGTQIGTFSANQSGAASVNISVPINLETDAASQNEVAVIGAEYARLSNGNRLVDGQEFDDYVEAQTPRAVIENKGFVIVEKANAPTGFTISDGSTGSSAMSLRVEEDEHDSSKMKGMNAVNVEVNGNSATVVPSGGASYMAIVDQTVKKSGTYHIRLSFAYTGTITSTRPNEVLVYVNGSLATLTALTNGASADIVVSNVSAGATILANFYCSVSSATFSNYVATVSNICLSREETAQSVANNSKLATTYARTIVAATSTTQNLRASYYESLNATLEKFRQAIIALGGTV